MNPAAMPESWESVNIEITLADTPVRMQFNVPADRVKLRRMLPLFNQMSNAFVEMGARELGSQGMKISCKAGCGACCRQLVPVSEAEAYELRDLVDRMPEPRRIEIRERFREGMQQLNDAKFFERLELASQGSEADYQEAVREYFTYGIACPFLENESCSIHTVRPVSCREYLVTSPPEYCASADGKGVNNVNQLLQVKESVISIARNKPSEELPYVPMIRILEWTDANKEESPDLPGREWIGRFLDTLQKLSKPA